jgi:ribonuclease PH
MARADGRSPDEMRPVKITRNFIPQAEGSALIELGNTKVICTATIENKVPFFLEGKDQGWVTAEYAMIPRATLTRSQRERGIKVGGRTQEIQRLIGRSLRCVVDMKKIPELTVVIDTDVISADGGTRTASITGAYVAMHEALNKMVNSGQLQDIPMKEYLAATSVGIVKGNIFLDLNYQEDSKAEVDMNVVMTGDGKIVEVQATGEKKAFSEDELNDLLKTAKKGVNQLFEIQKKILGD